MSIARGVGHTRYDLDEVWDIRPNIGSIVDNDDHALVRWEQPFEILRAEALQGIRRDAIHARRGTSILTAALVSAQHASAKDLAVWVDDLADRVGVFAGAHSVDVHLVHLGHFVEKRLKTRSAQQ